jgi:putative autotransporter adhesin-like protein
MQRSNDSTHGLRACLVAVGKSFAAVLVLSAPIAAQNIASVGPFRSIELHDGGHVSLRHGATQQVTFVKGNSDCARLSLNDGRLIIGKQHRCGHMNELEIEIVTPEIDELRVSDGGRIQTRGSFPHQGELKTSVSQGGVIDARTILADRITAAVEQGGQILLRPQVTLNARVSDGGQITYWDNPRVQSSVQHGGAVTKGSAADKDRPLS